MDVFAPGTVVRVLQEEWAPFENIRHTVARFEARTGVQVEVTLSTIPELWTLTERSFVEDDPPFDLIGADETMLQQHARLGHVEPLDRYVAADSYALDDFAAPALAAVSCEGHLYGIPYADISSVLIYRRDLLDRYDIGVPQTMDELTKAAVEVQTAVRADGRPDFHGITLRGAPNYGQGFWIYGSNWAPAWGARWYDQAGSPTLDTAEHHAALEHYVDLLRRAGPGASATMGFVECMACYRAGSAAMVIEPANEASVTYDLGGAVADGTMTTLVPAGPLGTRHAGLYCPPYSIPARSKVKDAAWELAKFLCAPEQLLDDARQSGFVEVARESVLADPRFAARFRQDLVSTTRATRFISRGERPITRQGVHIGDIVAEECAGALSAAQTVHDALRRAQDRVRALGGA